jgi:transposase
VNHVAIDLGSRESQICVRGSDGVILEEKRYPTRKLTELGPSRVILETSSEAFRVADAAKAAGHEVRVVPATMVRLLGVGERGVKNDQRDARQLSAASWRTDLPSVHIPSKESRELKSLCGARDLLVATQRNLSNNVRGWLRTQLWKLPQCTMKTLPTRVRAHAASLSTTLPEHVERQLQTLSLMTEQVYRLGLDGSARSAVASCALRARISKSPPFSTGSRRCPAGTTREAQASDDIPRSTC